VSLTAGFASNIACLAQACRERNERLVAAFATILHKVDGNR
jgi:hypothetical protein